MKIKSILWAIVIFIFPWLYIKGYFQLMNWKVIMTNQGTSLLESPEMWFTFIAHYSALALFMFLFYVVKGNKIPTLIGVSLAFIYLLLNILPFSVQAEFYNYPITAFFLTPVMSSYLLPAFFFFTYFIKIVQLSFYLYNEKRK